MIWILPLLVIIGAIVYFVVTKSNAATKTSESDATTETAATGESLGIYYYGETCSHCKELSEWIETNKIMEKVYFEKKEVWSNKENNNEMVAKAATCGIASDELGVPFFWVKETNKCLVGVPDIESYLKGKI